MSHNARVEPLRFAYWVPNVSGGLVISTINQRTDWGYGYNKNWQSGPSAPASILEYSPSSALPRTTCPVAASRSTPEIFQGGNSTAARRMAGRVSDWYRLFRPPHAAHRPRTQSRAARTRLGWHQPPHRHPGRYPLGAIAHRRPGVVIHGAYVGQGYLVLDQLVNMDAGAGPRIAPAAERPLLGILDAFSGSVAAFRPVTVTL